VIHIDNVSKIYKKGPDQVRALDQINLNIEEGRFLVIRGPSGSGKTTLLLAVGGMLRPNSGHIVIDERDIYKFSPAQKTRFQADNIGFVFQMFYLVPYLNIIENVLLAGGKSDNRKNRDKAMVLLDRLGLSERAFHKPPELSAGERQRTAIARAVMNQPKIILADEPTGNLDPDNTAIVNGYLEEFHAGGGTVIVVTHDINTDQYADQVIHLQNGKIADK
jgi:ABC-type lipoprotein export system ATPase subunit